MLKPPEIQALMEGFPQQCRSAGLKVTHQRVAIFNYLAGTESHPTPDVVYENIRTQLPSISLATVYKVLDQFHRHGFLRRISTEGQVARYDASLKSHQHLICDTCGLIRDLLSDETGADETGARGASTPPLPEVDDFTIDRCDVLFHGRCNACEATSSLPA